MRKDALPITVATLVMGIFGAFLRWLQNINIFDEGTGLAVKGSGFSAAYAVYSVVVLAVILGIVLVWLRRYDRDADAGHALHVFTAVPAVLTWIFCAVFVCGAIAVMFSSDMARYPMLQRIFGAAAILGGLCFPFVLGKRGSTQPGSMGRTAATFLVLFFCFWLVFSYKSNAENPVLWAYGPEILALAATAVGAYYVAAYFYSGRARPSAALAMVQLGAYLDISILSDSRGTWLNVMLAVSAAMMLLFEFILIANMREAPDRA